MRLLRTITLSLLFALVLLPLTATPTTAAEQGRRQVALTTKAVIANGASLSSAIDCSEFNYPCALWIPAWTAASLSFQSSMDGVTWGEMGDAAGLTAIASAAVDTSGAYVVLSPQIFGAVRHLKIRSGTKAASVNQAAERQITVFIDG